MTNGSSRADVSRFLVELCAPEADWRDVELIAARARSAAERSRQDGGQVRFLRTIYVPDDGTCFFLYEGPSAAAVTDAVRAARLDIAGIQSTTRVDGLHAADDPIEQATTPAVGRSTNRRNR